jgi:drug/metabolite transporter (DMT)-like permease
MEILLGLIAAVCWGVGDFAARFCSRRVGAWRTQMYMQLFGAAVLTLYLWRAGDFPHLAALGWRVWIAVVIGGVLNAFASPALYRAFEIGTMSVAAPVSSAYPAITVSLALLSGERMDATRAVGLTVIFVGMILAAISWSPVATDGDGAAASGGRRWLVRGAGWAVVSAVGFGVMFWWIGFHVVTQLGAVASVWAVRVTTFLVLLMTAVPARQNVALPRGKVWFLLAVIGLVDTVAYVSNNVGMALGHVSIVTVLSSLYGAVTVLLGAIFVRERLAKSRWLGIGLIFCGIVLVNV